MTTIVATRGSSSCRARLLNDAEYALLAPIIDALAANYHGYESLAEPPYPTQIYATLTRHMPDPYITARIRALYSDSALGRIYKEGAGYVYGFIDCRDGDPSLVKIGETSRSPYIRLDEWRDDLGCAGMSPSPLALLFAYRCRRRRLAEKTIHLLLALERDQMRINRGNNRLLTEYFHIRSLSETKLLVHAVTHHINWFDARLHENDA